MIATEKPEEWFIFDCWDEASAGDHSTRLMCWAIVADGAEALGSRSKILSDEFLNRVATGWCTGRARDLTDVEVSPRVHADRVRGVEVAG